MRKINILVSIILIMALLLSGCKNSENKENHIEEKNSETLKIYLAGDEVGGSAGSYYQTRYSIGEFLSHAVVWGEEGHMYYDAIEEFKKNSSLEVELTFFNTTDDLLMQAEQEMKKGKGPDVIIGSYTSTDYCLYPYIEEGMFADLTPYFEQDEIYTNDEYFSTVLEGGNLQGGQYFFPLTFNMNILMSSKESLQNHNLPLKEDQTYNEMVSLFTNAWGENREEDERLTMQFSNMWNDYAYVLFDASSGLSLIDYETGEITLDFEYFSQLAELYKAYLMNDYGMTQEELKQMASKNDGFLDEKYSRYGKINNLAVSKMLNAFDELHDQIGCFSEGGNSSYFMHSFAAEAGYYESRYTDKNEEFICIGIPAKSGEQNYAAQITSFGAVLNGSSNEEEGYRFIKCLADTKRFMHFDLSVNRNVTKETLDELCETSYEFYPAEGNFPPEGAYEDEKWKGEAYTIRPMTKQTREYLENMMAHIDKALLPEWRLHRCMTKEIEEYIFGQTDSLEVAYQNAFEEMKKCINVDHIEENESESQSEEQSSEVERAAPIKMQMDLSAKEMVARCMEIEFPEVNIEDWEITDWGYELLERLPEIKPYVKECYAIGKQNEEGPDILILCFVYNEDDDSKDHPLGMQMRSALKEEITAMAEGEEITQGVEMNMDKFFYFVATEGYRFRTWGGAGFIGGGDLKRLTMPPW